MSTNQQTKYRQVRVSEQDHADLKLLAFESGHAMSKLVGRMIHDLLQIKGGREKLVENISKASDVREILKKAQEFVKDPMSSTFFSKNEAKESHSENPPIAPKAPTG